VLVSQAPKDPPPLSGFSLLAFEPGVEAAIGNCGCRIIAKYRKGVGIGPVLGNLFGNFLSDRSLHSRIGWISRHGTLPASGEGVSCGQVPDVGARGSHCDRDSAVPGRVTMDGDARRLPRKSQDAAGTSRSTTRHLASIRRVWTPDGRPARDDGAVALLNWQQRFCNVGADDRRSIGLIHVSKDCTVHMKTSLDHLPPVKRHELQRVLEIVHEEFEDALKGATADFKKRGRILKIILFGSYARGTYVDEQHVNKGYRSDFDILVIVNDKKLTEFATYWQKADDRLMRSQEISTPTSIIVHTLREVNTQLRRGQYFFSDIRRDGIALYELNDEPLAMPGKMDSLEAWRTGAGYLADRLPGAASFLDTAQYLADKGQIKHASFELHQSIEQAYSTLLLVLTNYSPPSHNLRRLRGLAESQAPEIISVWPRHQQREVAWFNVLNEAYVKARYSPHYEISKEALDWLQERTSSLIAAVEKICLSHLERTRPPQT
jgi:uncharacterized protein